MNAVITGATKGMGRAIAIKLAQLGYDLALCARKQTEIDTFCQELMAINPSINAAGLSTDCINPADVESFANFVQQHFPKVDVLINNVGVYYPGSLLDEDDNSLSEQWQVNVNTAYSLCRTFGRQMRQEKSGHIINICSIASINPVAEAGSYTVTKFALLGLTRVLRLELMDHNVKVTAILPGSTLTNSWAGTEIPANRLVAAEDISNAVAFCLQNSVGANPDELVISPAMGQV